MRDFFSEEELVRSALIELDRRQAARAAGTDLTVSPGMDDPKYDRLRLLFEHPEMARKLGLEVPSAASTRPGN